MEDSSNENGKALIKRNILFLLQIATQLNQN